MAVNGAGKKSARRKAEMEAQERRDSGGGRKLLTCLNCGGAFTEPISRGQYPGYCRKSTCQRIRRLRSNGAKSVLTDEQRAHRLAEDRERERRIAARQPPQERVTAQAECQAEEDAADRDRRAQRLSPLIEDETTTTVLGEVVAAAGLAAERRGASRSELRQEIRKLAYAEGVEPTYDALISLAATALGFASRIRPPVNQRDPDYERVPELIEAAERDYPELMVA